MKQILAALFLTLMQVAPEADHLRLQTRRCGLDKQEVHHVHLLPDLVCELDMLTIAPTEQKLHVSSSEQTAHAIWAGTQDSPSPTQYVPLWSTQLDKSTRPKAGHVILCPFGSSSIFVPKFFI